MELPSGPKEDLGGNGEQQVRILYQILAPQVVINMVQQKHGAIGGGRGNLHTAAPV